MKVQEKILELEQELILVKQMVTQRPNFDIDEQNWKKLKSTTKSIRQTLYQERYGKA